MGQQSKLGLREVYVVDGNRTPFLKARGPGRFSASDLAVQAGQSLLKRQAITPASLDNVIVGSVLPSVDETNIARQIALRLGCGDKMPAFTVARNCASGMQALDSAALEISSGRSDLILAGGTDAMSRAPLIYNAKATLWFASWMAAKSPGERAGLLLKLRPSFLAPVVALLRGLSDPLIGMNMGQTAEKLAWLFHITREEMDAFSAQSHQRLLRAYEEGIMEEVTPIIDDKGKLYERDDGMREDSTPEKLSTLLPFFDKKYGMVTAGNSSQISDGACLLLLASKDAVKKYQLPVLGRIIDSEWAALAPSEMGLGPVHAATPLLMRHELTPKDIDGWEINEAFAAQVLACLKVWDSDEYCKNQLGLKGAFGAPSLSQLNQDGGAIALGHPVGASGARIVLHLLKSLQSRGKKRGVAAICIGGGQGGAMYVECLNGVNGASL